MALNATPFISAPASTLIHAVVQGNLKQVCALLAAGESPNQFRPVVETDTSSPAVSPLMVATQLATAHNRTEAEKATGFEIMKLLLSAGATPSNTCVTKALLHTRELSRYAKFTSQPVSQPLVKVFVLLRDAGATWDRPAFPCGNQSLASFLSEHLPEALSTISG